MNASSGHRCLLCDHPEPENSASLTGRELRILWDTLKNHIGESAYGTITPETDVILYRCRSCGFRFFNPEFAGSAEFYEELMASKTYPLGSPEFDRAIQFARRKGIGGVLDVGGGEGAFLDQAKLAGLKTAGVELNRHASQVAASKGHRMFNTMMEDIPLESLDGGAEFLTLFQVVEHVPSPVEFLQAASRLVKPGGYLAVAVPSDKRMLGLLANDPADWPPHHVSRWRLEDLKTLGEKAGLHLFEQHVDPFYGRALPWAFKLHTQLGNAINRQPYQFPLHAVNLASLFYRALKLQKFLPFHGLSLFTIYRKPEF